LWNKLSEKERVEVFRLDGPPREWQPVLKTGDAKAEAGSSPVPSADDVSDMEYFLWNFWRKIVSEEELRKFMRKIGY
jgi:hypothetical protein